MSDDINKSEYKGIDVSNHFKRLTEKVNTKEAIIKISINAFCLIAILICQLISGAIKSPLYMGQAAKAWAGQSGDRFAQFAVYIPEVSVFNEESVYKLRDEIDKQLRSVSLEGGESRKLYNDAWSASGKVAVTGERGNATASAIGVGGDFFLFHPLVLRSGSYLRGDDIMRDRIVIDEELAWRLFGSVSLAGMKVSINNRPFIVAGVISRQSRFAFNMAYEDGPGLFMSYEALGEIAGSSAKINTYEIVMPDPVSGFAKELLKTSLNDEMLHIADNTSRFSFSDLMGIIGSFGERSLRKEAIMYPYWENAARYAEDWLALLLFISMLLALVPAGFAVFYGIRLIRFGIKRGKAVVIIYLEKRENHRYQQYIKDRSSDFTGVQDSRLMLESITQAQIKPDKPIGNTAGKIKKLFTAAIGKFRRK